MIFLVVVLFVCILPWNAYSSGWKDIKMSAQLIHCIMLVKSIFHDSQLPYSYNKLNGVDKLEGSVIMKTLGNFGKAILVEDLKPKHTFSERRRRR